MKITCEEEALAIIEEFERDYLVNRTPEFVDNTFSKQAAFINDPYFRKAAQCTRRAGKSFGVGRALFKEAYDYPGCSVLYLALTRRSAENIMWKDVIKRLNKDLMLGGKPHESKLMFVCPNGSQIMLAGADSTHEEMEKYLGGAYRCVIIDEAGSFRQDLRKLIYENLEPAVADYEGWVGMIGTPTELTTGLFYDVTNGIESGWSVHRWDTFDNPYMRDKWRRRVDLLIKTNPRIIETPSYKRMYLNQWIVDKDSLCYKYKHPFNDVPEIPKHKNGELSNVLGIDLGFNDSSAFVIASFNEHEKTLWFRDPFKKSEMIITDVAHKIREYIDKYNPIACVVDNASKQAVEELKQRFGLPLEAAEKTEKHQFIEIMNSDFLQGYIKLVGPQCDPMRKEYGALIWDEKARPKKWIEHPSCDNHLADASLYAWRKCYPYLSRAKPPDKTDQEKIDSWFDEKADEFDNPEKPFWER